MLVLVVETVGFGSKRICTVTIAGATLVLMVYTRVDKMQDCVVKMFVNSLHRNGCRECRLWGGIVHVLSWSERLILVKDL